MRESESHSVVSDCDPIDYTVHRILQARLLEWVAFPFSRGSSQPRDRTQVSWIASGFSTSWATREAQDEGKRGGKLSDLKMWWTKMRSTPGYRKELMANGLPFHMSTLIDWWWLSAGGLPGSIKGSRWGSGAGLPRYFSQTQGSVCDWKKTYLANWSKVRLFLPGKPGWKCWTFSSFQIGNFIHFWRGKKYQEFFRKCMCCCRWCVTQARKDWTPRGKLGSC